MSLKQVQNALNRETGSRPVRSRRCKDEVASIGHWLSREGEANDDSEPEELPAYLLFNASRGMRKVAKRAPSRSFTLTCYGCKCNLDFLLRLEVFYFGGHKLVSLSCESRFDK